MAFYSILYVISLRTRTTDPDLVGSGSVVRVTPPIEPSLTLFVWGSVPVPRVRLGFVVSSITGTAATAKGTAATASREI